MLSVRFEVHVGVFLLLAPTGAKAPFPLVGYPGIQPVIHKSVPAKAPAGAGSYRKHCVVYMYINNYNDQSSSSLSLQLKKNNYDLSFIHLQTV